MKKELSGFDPIRRGEALRRRMINLKNKKILLASFKGASQASDIPEAQRFGDYFRVKIYTKRKEIGQGFDNFRSEPAGIAAQKLGANIAECNAVFLGQVNGCNLKCWQCYVDDKNKSGNPKYGKFFSAEEILIKFHRRLIDEGLDVYTYLYPLVYSNKDLRNRLKLFILRLQEEVSLYAPLRLTTPYTKVYSPTKTRLTPERELALKLQYEAMKIWKQEMRKAYGDKADRFPHEVQVDYPPGRIMTY